MKISSAILASANIGVVRFAFVGGGGFLVDTAITLILLDYFGVLGARAVGFGTAVAITFFFNRKLSFGSAKVQVPLLEAFSYFVIQSTGAALNFLVFLILVFLGSETRPWLLLYLSVSAVAGLVWNYSISRVFIYERRGKKGNLYD